MPDKRPTDATTVAARGATMLDWMLFVALCGLLAVRLLIPESFGNFDLPFAEDLSSGPTRATTVWLDWLTLLVSCIAIVRTGIMPRAALFGCGLLIVATVLSVLAADAKRVALNASGTLIAMSAAGIAVSQLTRSGIRQNLLVAAILASGALNAVKCFQQRGYEFAETAEAWQQRKIELAQSGEDVLDPLYANFERRLLSQNAFGYLAHPNVAASVMMMGAVGTAGIAIAGLRSRGKARILAVLGGGAFAAILFAGIYFTGSKGALLAGAIGIIVIVACNYFFLSGGARFRFAAVVCFGGFSGLLGWGLVNGTLPGDSLAFRWEYWTTAAKALPDSPLLGMGRENFIAAHMRYKLASATEEVRNPHNLWISLLVEMGPLGLIAGLLLIGGLARRLAFAATLREPEQSACFSRPAFLAVLAIVPLLHAGFSGTPFMSPGILVLWAIETALAWTILFALAFWILQWGEHFSATAATVGLGVLCATLLHNLVDFSLLMPSGLAGFVALTCAATGALTVAARRRFLIPGAAAAVFILLMFFATIVYPTAAAESLSSRAEEHMRRARSPQDMETANVEFLAAAMTDSLDADLPRRAGLRFLSLAERPGTAVDWSALWFAHAQEFASLSKRRAPSAYGTLRLVARTVDRRRDDAGVRKSSTAGTLARGAAQCWEQVINAYPTNPQDRIEAGYAQIKAWKLTQADDAMLAAMRHFAAAFQIDDTRPSENASKLRISEIERIRDGLKLLQSRPPATNVNAEPTSTSAPNSATQP